MRRIIALALLVLTAPLSGAQELFVFDSPNLHCTDSVLVFSPSADKDLPTLFLLHGFGGKYSDWSRHTDLQAAAESSGFRIICPDGFYKSWYLNDANPANMQWRKFFWEECWPAMEKRYGLKADKTFVDGLSMGGHGAMNLFLDHPERFRGAGSMSGVLGLHHSGGSKEIIPAILGVESIYDPVCAEQSAINRLYRVGTAAPQKIIVISCGTEDKFMIASKEFEQRCTELGIPHVTLYSPGKHTWQYWVWLLPYHLKFFSEAL